MRTLPITASAVVVLDGSGNGTASIGPTSSGERWIGGFTAAVRASTNVKEAIASVYCGAGVSPAYYVGGTSWGSTGDSTSNTPGLAVGQNVFAVWTGGDAGSTAYLSVTGTRQVA